MELSGPPVAPIVSGNHAGARSDRLPSISERFLGRTAPRELPGSIFNADLMKSLMGKANLVYKGPSVTLTKILEILEIFRF